MAVRVLNADGGVAAEVGFVLRDAAEAVGGQLGAEDGGVDNRARRQRT